MSKPSAKKAAKKNARAKQVKKAANIQVEAARRAAQANMKAKIERKLNRRYKSTDDLVSGMINDSMEIFNNIETIRQICKGRIDQVSALKNTNPNKYGALDSSEFDRLLEKIVPMQDLAKKMLVTAAKLEDMRKSEASSADQMETFVSDMQNLSDLQVMYMDLMNMFNDVNAKFKTELDHPAEADKTLGDISDEMLEEPEEVSEAPEVEAEEVKSGTVLVTDDSVRPAIHVKHVRAVAVEIPTALTKDGAYEHAHKLAVEAFESLGDEKKDYIVTVQTVTQDTGKIEMYNYIWIPETGDAYFYDGPYVVEDQLQVDAQEEAPVPHPEQFFGTAVN